MSDDRNAAAIRTYGGNKPPAEPRPDMLAGEQLTPPASKCLQKESNLQPCGNGSSGTPGRSPRTRENPSPSLVARHRRSGEPACANRNRIATAPLAALSVLVGGGRMWGR